MSYSELLRENQDLRERNKELEKKLFLHLETGIISRASFRNYVQADLGRNESDIEWSYFITTFTYDTRAMNDKIYEWINKYMRKTIIQVVFEEWPADLD